MSPDTLCQDDDCPDGKPYPNMRPNNALNPRAIHYHTPEGVWYPPLTLESYSTRATGSNHRLTYRSSDDSASRA